MVLYIDDYVLEEEGKLFQVEKHSCRKMSLPRWLSGKESAYNAGDLGLIPGLGIYPGIGNSNPFHYSCLGNPMDRGAWRGTVQRVVIS